MPKKDRTGRRVQIYLPADLIEQWERTPRYERSATVAKALRVFWGKSKEDLTSVEDTDQDTIGQHTTTKRRIAES